MKNYRILLVANGLFVGVVGVMMPFLSLYQNRHDLAGPPARRPGNGGRLQIGLEA
jgi:hypothetical protein